MWFDAELRQEDIANRTGEHQSFVSKYESGEIRLDVLQLRQVFAALGVSLAIFMDRLDSKIQGDLDAGPQQR